MIIQLSETERVILEDQGKDVGVTVCYQQRVKLDGAFQKWGKNGAMSEECLIPTAAIKLVIDWTKQHLGEAQVTRPLTQQERASLALRILTVAATASDAKLIALTKMAEGSDATVVEPPRAAEYMTVPPLGRDKKSRICCKCRRWLVPNSKGPVVHLPTGEWRHGTTRTVMCPTRKHERATDCEMGR